MQKMFDDESELKLSFSNIYALIFFSNRIFCLTDGRHTNNTSFMAFVYSLVICLKNKENTNIYVRI